MVGFTDFDLTRYPNDQNLNVGYVFTLGFEPVSWSCKKQSALALSLEVEYRASIYPSQEAMGLQ